MPCEFTCDGCGAKAPGFANHQGDWLKPSKWYQRTTDDLENKRAPFSRAPKDAVRVTQVACSRACLEKLGGLVAPW